MAKPITIPNTFASATSAIPLSQLDQDFSTLANATNDLATYSNYVADTGAADAYIANFPANTNTSSLTTGLTVQFKAANANTGASTLNVQVNGASIGTAAIRYANGSALAAGAIAAGAMVSVMYDGTNFQLINDPAGQSGGDVTGPASATDNAIARFDGASGKLIQNSVVTIADTTGDMSGVGTLSAGNVTVSGTANAATLIVTGNSTLGDASGDTLTITGTTVTTPNGLNFDSNTLVIDATNNRVGIGTASPTQNLDVFGSIKSSALTSGRVTYAGTGGLLQDSSGFTFDGQYVNIGNGLSSPNGIKFLANGGGLSGSLTFNHSTGEIQNYANTAYFPTFYSNNAERMRINTSGNVGIGTSSPAQILHLSATSPTLRIDSTAAFNASPTSAIAFVGTYNSGGGLDSFATIAATKENTTDGNASAALRFLTNTSVGNQTEKMRIDSSGNVGIGISSPGGRLDVSGTSRVRFQTEFSGYVYTTFINAAGNLYNRSIMDASQHEFYISGSERMRIDSSGNVVVGATSSGSGAQFHVTVPTATNPAIGWISNSNTAYPTSSFGGALGMNFTAGGAEVDIWNNYETAVYSFDFLQKTGASAASRVLRINPNGTLNLLGANVLSGVGIAFPATQSASSDANTLDDYEEGTWTPTDTSGAGLTFTVTGAQYVKVGQMVTAIAIFQYPSTTNGNTCSIGGLPFTTNLNNSTGSILSNNAGAQKMICSGTTTILLFPVNSVNQSTNATLSTASIYLSITYRSNT